MTVSEAKGVENGSPQQDRPVFFFDIDNCLYSRSHRIHDRMQELIDKFFAKHLGLDWEDAVTLHQRYYKEYGLAIKGLTLNHKIDALEFNREVDDALPLDSILQPNMKLRKLLSDIDASKVKLWLFTNAYVNHAKRVMKLLGVDDLFEGVTYCDYKDEDLICKPLPAAFEKAEIESGASGINKCYFVDDSALNCRHAEARGWTTVHFVEPQVPVPETQAAKFQIRDLEELRDLFPWFFRARNL